MNGHRNSGKDAQRPTLTHAALRAIPYRSNRIVTNKLRPGALIPEANTR